MIRFATISSIVIALALQGAAAQKSRIIRPVRDDVGIYQHEIRKVFETPLFTVGTSDRLQVIADGKHHSRITDNTGREGWVEKRLCVTAPGNKLITFDPATIENYIDNKSIISITAGLPPGEQPIRLDRSFKDALGENVDRETIGRMCADKKCFGHRNAKRCIGGNHTEKPRCTVFN